MIYLKKLFLPMLFVLGLTIPAMAQIHQDQPATEISLPNADGKMVSLSSLKGKVVLIDFWASWCGPCRASNRKLTKIYDKYKDKGFEIYGISVDDDRDKWLSAVKKDKITWLQVIGESGVSSQVVGEWSVYEIPTSYLLDKEGNVIAMNPEGKELTELLEKLL